MTKVIRNLILVVVVMGITPDIALSQEKEKQEKKQEEPDHCMDLAVQACTTCGFGSASCLKLSSFAVTVETGRRTNTRSKTQKVSDLCGEIEDILEFERQGQKACRMMQRVKFW